MDELFLSCPTNSGVRTIRIRGLTYQPNGIPEGDFVQNLSDCFNDKRAPEDFRPKQRGWINKVPINEEDHGPHGKHPYKKDGDPPHPYKKY